MFLPSAFPVVILTQPLSNQKRLVGRTKPARPDFGWLEQQLMKKLQKHTGGQTSIESLLLNNPKIDKQAVHTRPSVLQCEVLVLKLVAIDGLAPSAVVFGEVSPLAHEVRDDTMECAALVAETLLSSAEGTEVLRCFWHHITA